MKYVAAALAASRAVAPYEETVGRKPANESKPEPEPADQTAKRRRSRRQVEPSDAWKPTNARA